MNKLWRMGLLGCLLVSAAATADLPPDKMFQVEKIGSRDGRHIVVLGDFSIPFATDGRSHILDADSGDYLGVINTGFWHGGVMLPKSRNIIVSAETYFSRGTRGKRTDIVAFYDGDTLEANDETRIPPKRFTPVKMQATSVLSDDDRFAFVLNHTPAASVSVVDIERREFVVEVDIPGCFYLYPTGNRSFNAICANGSFLSVELDDAGSPVELTRTDVLFDTEEDLVTSGGVRVGDTWYHVSQKGFLYGFKTTDAGTEVLPHWSLFSDAERQDDWRISGFQHLAVHTASDRAYVLTHQGGPETFEDPGTEVWIYDLNTKQRIEIIQLQRMALSIEVSQDKQAQLYALAADFNIPEELQGQLLQSGDAHILEKIMDLVLDVYNLDDRTLQLSIKDIGAFPSYIQVWPATETDGG